MVQQVFSNSDGTRQGYIEQKPGGYWYAEAGTGAGVLDAMRHIPKLASFESDARDWVKSNLQERDALDKGARVQGVWSEDQTATAHF